MVLLNRSCMIPMNTNGIVTASRPMGKPSLLKTIASAWLFRNRHTSFYSKISWKQSLQVIRLLQITHIGISSGQKNSMNSD